MKTQHQDLAGGRWQSLSLAEQMANVGSEVERALLWKKQNNDEYSRRAFERALELLDLSLTSGLLSKFQLRELSRTREVLVDYFDGENIYASTPKLWQTYFGAFTYAARLKHGA